MRPHRVQPFAVLGAVLLFAVALVALVPRMSLAQNACGTEFQDPAGDTFTNGDTVCQVASGSKCTFELSLCVNKPGATGGTCTPQNLKTRKIHATGHCGGIGKLSLKPNGTAALCQTTPAMIRVHTKKSKAGTCKIRAGGGTVAKITLTCMPSTGTCPTTTTTTITGTPTTSTIRTACASSPTGTKVKGSLIATLGRFNYNLMLGLPGANAACNTNFPGSHACSVTELQGAPASDLACLKDTAGMAVTSFWAIAADAATVPSLQQCEDDVVSGRNWEYATAHTASRGEVVALTNSTGALGAVQMGVQCNISGMNWVGCCQ